MLIIDLGWVWMGSVFTYGQYKNSGDNKIKYCNVRQKVN